jgi:hypothetical protein
VPCWPVGGAWALNATLKKLLTEAMLDNTMLKDVAAKNRDARRAPHLQV